MRIPRRGRKSVVAITPPTRNVRGLSVTRGEFTLGRLESLALKEGRESRHDFGTDKVAQGRKRLNDK
jgi:hypothetical protein